MFGRKAKKHNEFLVSFVSDLFDLIEKYFEKGFLLQMIGRFGKNEEEIQEFLIERGLKKKPKKK